MHSDPQKAIFLDRDGIINREGGDYTWLLEDFRFNDGLIPALLKFQQAGYILIVISNQGGIAKGIYTKADADYLHLHMQRVLSNQGIHLSEVYYCPHHQDTGKCLCRKPESILIEKAIARFHIDPSHSWFIGDADRDTEAATRAGVPAIKLASNSPLEQACIQILGEGC